MGRSRADRAGQRFAAAEFGPAGATNSSPGWRSGVGSSQPQFAFQIVQLSELTASDGGFALADCFPIVLAERFGGIVNQELQEPVGNREFLVWKQFYKLVKSFFGARNSILRPGGLGYGEVPPMRHAAAVALTLDCFIPSLTVGVLYGGRAGSKERADDAHLQPLVHLTAPFDHDEGNDMVGVVNGEDNSPASDTRLSQIAHSGERAGDAGMVGGLSQFINAKANSPLQLSVQAIEVFAGAVRELNAIAQSPFSCFTVSQLTVRPALSSARPSWIAVRLSAPTDSSASIPDFRSSTICLSSNNSASGSSSTIRCNSSRTVINAALSTSSIRSNGARRRNR